MRLSMAWMLWKPTQMEPFWQLFWVSVTCLLILKWICGWQIRKHHHYWCILPASLTGCDGSRVLLETEITSASLPSPISIVGISKESRTKFLQAFNYLFEGQVTPTSEKQSESIFPRKTQAVPRMALARLYLCAPHKPLLHLSTTHSSCNWPGSSV